MFSPNAPPVEKKDRRYVGPRQERAWHPSLRSPRAKAGSTGIPRCARPAL